MIAVMFLNKGEGEEIDPEVLDALEWFWAEEYGEEEWN